MEWKFSQLDEDRDGVLKKQELKTFRESIQKVNLAEVAHSLGIFSVNRSWEIFWESFQTKACCKSFGPHRNWEYLGILFRPQITDNM
jgi:hypothetical protein